MGLYVFKLPDVGEGTAEAELVEWKVAVGDRVEEDAPLADVMTDKATVELTSPVAGVVKALHGEPGEMRAVKSALVELEVEGAGGAEEPVPSAGDAGSSPAGGGGEPAPSPPPPPAAEVSPQRTEGASGRGDYVFRLPDVGEGTAEAELVAWKVAVGDRVEEDAPLADVMTDKATVELTAPVAGVVTALHGEVGQMLAVKAPLVELDTGRGVAPSGGSTASSPASGGGVRAADGGGKSPSTEAHQRAPSGGGFARSQGLGQPAFATRNPGLKPLASPAVRRRAHELGVELQYVPGSGPAGRIAHADLDAWLARDHAPVPAATSDSRYARRETIDAVKVIGLRRRIAQSMQESKRRIPHFAYVEEVDMTALEELRAHLNATHSGRSGDRPKLTVLPFFARALVKTLPAYPQINARFDDDAGVVHRHAAVHLGIATQTPNGLIVPVVRHAEALDLWAFATEVARLAEATRAGKARGEELSGSTLTLTSLGPLGGIATTPVINYPEVAIIGPNKIVERPVVRAGVVVVRKMMNLSSSFDHRVVDGYDAAEFIQKVKALLENPAALFID